MASEISLRQSPARSREFRPSESAAAAATDDKTVRKYMEKGGKAIQFVLDNSQLPTFHVGSLLCSRSSAADGRLHFKL